MLRLRNLKDKYGDLIKKLLLEFLMIFWRQYGTDAIDLEYEHNFKQLAWIQISQFNATDLLKEINQTTIYEELPKI